MKKYLFFFLLLFGFFLFPKDTYALNGNGFQIIMYDENNSQVMLCNNNTYCKSGVLSPNNIKRVSIKYQYFSVTNESNYELFSSIVIGVPGNNLDTSIFRSDKWIGNYNTTEWKQISPWWDVVDSYNYNSQTGFYDMEWGSVYSWTNTPFSSNGITFDFYFVAPLRIYDVQILRFDLVNTGSQVSDSVNNATNNIINNNNNNTQNIINSQQEINDSITSEEPPDTIGFTEELFEVSPFDPTIQSLLSVPLNIVGYFYTAFSANASCQQINFGTLYGTNLYLPCINLQQRLGSTVWNTIDAFLCFFMIINIIYMCIHLYDKITSIDDDFEELYMPTHGLLSRVGRGHRKGLY